MPGYGIQRRRGTTAQHSTFTGLLAELTVDTDKKTVVVHDGVTPGGFPLAREDATVGGGFMSVKHPLFGAKGNGTVDDTAAIQSAVSWGVTHGATIFFPDGTYKVSSTITIDESGNTDQESPRVRIVGSGVNSAKIKWTGGSSRCFWYKGPESNWLDGSVHSYSGISDIHLIGVGKQGTAIHIENAAYFRMDNVTIRGFADGIYGEDILSSTFTNVIVRECARGITGLRKYTPEDNSLPASQRDYESGPNNLNFYGCIISSCHQFGIYMRGGATLNYHGGSIENIGLDAQGGTGTRWGVKIDNAGVEGAVGCTFFGTYFEGNHGYADVWVEQADSSPEPKGNGAAYSFDGCTFNRISSAEYTTFNILFQTNNTPGSLKVTGCGFAALNDYVPSSGRPCIQVPTAGRGWKAYQKGNFFSSDEDSPLWTETPTFMAVLNASQSISNDSETVVGFSTSEDYGNCFDSGDHSFVAPYSLRMNFSVNLSWVGFISSVDVGDDIELRVKVNGNLVRQSDHHVKVSQTMHLNFDLNLRKGDRVKAYIYINTGGVSRTIYSNPITTYFTGHPV